jgi:ribosomal protein S18 acetylase RimI-like enzyme
MDVAEEFLREGDHTALEQAAAQNHQERFVLMAQASGGEAHSLPGITWTWSEGEQGGMILFPRLSGSEAGATLDAIVQFYRDRKPKQMVGCWSLDPTEPDDLDIRLLARGFQSGWQPCWMALDMEPAIADFPLPEGVEIRLFEGGEAPEAANLPYYSQEMAHLHHTAARLSPRRVWHWGAFQKGKLIGHSVLYLSRGSQGAAGIYSVGVLPEARNRGIGKAVTRAACMHGRAAGCRYALLNATGERMYRQLGFERIGYGKTWWLNVSALNAQPLSPERTALAEAVGRADLPALQSMSLTEPDMPLPNGMTLLQVAVHCQAHDSAVWLLSQGATLDILSAWDLGWKERIPALVANPDLLNRRYGELQITPLHIAVERNDLELAQSLLAGNPDLTATDAVYHSTPLGWARHFGRTGIAAMIEARAGR